MICKKCGLEIQDDVKYCPACGEELLAGEEVTEEVTEEATEEATEGTAAPAPAEEGFNMGLIIGIIAVVAVVAIVVIVVIAKKKK